jgi:hypothetical protein
MSMAKSFDKQEKLTELHDEKASVQVWVTRRWFSSPPPPPFWFCTLEAKVSEDAAACPVSTKLHWQREHESR